MNKNTSYHKGIWSRFAAKGQDKVSVWNCLNSMTQHHPTVEILIRILEGVPTQWGRLSSF